MIKAVIDIGSNSIKMRIADTAGISPLKVLCDETEFVRLGRGMSASGTLSSESMRLSSEAVTRMISKAERLGARIIMIVGTMALRTASNASDFVKLVKEQTGHDVKILSGEEEAKYSWLGASDGFEIDGEAVMFDTGGGSTEFIKSSEGSVKKVTSTPVGAVNLSERFFGEFGEPAKKSQIDEALSYVNKIFVENEIGSFKAGKIIATGGGVAAMSAVKNACENFIPSKLHGTVLTLNDAVRQIKLYSSLTLSERENIIGLPKSRADIILGSACIVYSALNVLEAKTCTVSINGLRHGLLLYNNNLK
ncbi:MAG: hypothetical protein IJQ74_01975 [Synergistaceae bacterium]|nr:hypothetical protein [Synergistaceae bacterium]MBQ7267207.1 hypothetical protein [Synergistaceae bacterium]